MSVYLVRFWRGKFSGFVRVKASSEEEAQSKAEKAIVSKPEKFCISEDQQFGAYKAGVYLPPRSPKEVTIDDEDIQEIDGTESQAFDIE